jgi:hypothetical protein
MAITPADISRLKSTLQTSGIQGTNQPLFQVINQLIGLLADINSAGASSKDISNIVQKNTTQISLLSLGDEGSSDDPIVIPGLKGSDGSIGRDGISFISEDGIDGLDGFPGIRGIDGLAGPQGPVGPIMILEDGIDGQDGLNIPNPGPAGATGAQGPVGPVIIVVDGEDGLDGIFGTPGPAGANGTSGISGTNGPPGIDGADGDTSDSIVIPPTIIPDIALSAKAPANNELITPYYSAYIVHSYEIILDYFTEIGLGASFEVG